MNLRPVKLSDAKQGKLLFLKNKTSLCVSCLVLSNSLRHHGLYVACHAPLTMGFPRQEYWSGLPFPSPGDFPDPGIEPRSPALQAVSLLTELGGKPPYTSKETSKSFFGLSLFSLHWVLCDPVSVRHLIQR